MLDRVAAALDGRRVDEVELAELVVLAPQAPGVEGRAVAFLQVVKGAGEGHGGWGERGLSPAPGS
jgi:hypothetical protein